MRKVGYVSLAELDSTREALAAISSHYAGTFSNMEYKDYAWCNWEFRDQDEFDRVAAATTNVKWIDTDGIRESKATIQTEVTKETMKRSESADMLKGRISVK